MECHIFLHPLMFHFWCATSIIIMDITIVEISLNPYIMFLGSPDVWPGRIIYWGSISHFVISG